LRSARPSLWWRNAKPESRCTLRSASLSAIALTGPRHRLRSDHCRGLDRTCPHDSVDRVGSEAARFGSPPPGADPQGWNHLRPVPVIIIGPCGRPCGPGTVLPRNTYPRGGAVLWWKQSGVVKKKAARVMQAALTHDPVNLRVSLARCLRFPRMPVERSHHPNSRQHRRAIGSATSNRACIAARLSGASCSAFGSFVM
jgi:hypothetical protein